MVDIGIGSSRLLQRIDRATADMANDSEVRDLLRGCRAEIHALAHSYAANRNKLQQVRHQRNELVRLCHHYTDLGLSEILGVCDIPHSDFDASTVSEDRADPLPNIGKTGESIGNPQDADS